MKARATATIVTGLALSALFLWLALKDVNFREVGDVLGQARWIFAVPFIACLTGFWWLKILRWRALIRPAGNLSPRQLAMPLMAGFALNNLLPARIGEIARIVLAGNTLGLGKSFVLGTVAAERVLDVVSVAGVVGAGLMISPALPEALNRTGWILLAAAFAGAAVAAWLAIAPRSFTGFARAMLGWAPARPASYIVERLGQVAEGFAALRDMPGLLMMLGNSLMQWLALAACIFIAFGAVGVSVTPTAALVTLGLVVVGISLPSSPGFFGAIELAFVVALAAFDIGPNAAIGAAIFYHALTWMLVTGSGLLLMYRAGISLGSVRRSVDNPGGDQTRTPAG